MARVRKYMNLTNRWEETAQAVNANLTELSHLEVPLGRLNGVTEKTRSLLAEQNALTAAKQVTSQQLRQAIREGETLVDLLRTGVRQHYGHQESGAREAGARSFRPGSLRHHKCLFRRWRL